MKKITFGFLAALLGLNAMAFGVYNDTDTDSITFNITVQEVHLIDIADAVANFTIDAPTQAGDSFSDTASTGSSYAITVNSAHSKIAGQLNQSLPTGLTMFTTFQSPLYNGTSAGEVELTNASQDLVTGIEPNASSGNTIDFRLESSDVPLTAMNDETYYLTVTVSAT